MFPAQNFYYPIPHGNDGPTINLSKASSTYTPRTKRASRQYLIALTALLSLFTTFAITAHFFPLSQVATLIAPNIGSVNAIAHLGQPLDDLPTSVEQDVTSCIVGEHHEVTASYPADYVWVDAETRIPFEHITYKNGRTNSAIGRMPRPSPYDALVLARGWNGEYHDERLEVPLMNLTVVGFFVNWNADEQKWLRAGPAPYILDLPVYRQFPRPCTSNANGGPADPRFLWSDRGEPLAVIGTTSAVPGVCKAVGMVDLRAVWPALKDHLDEINHDGGPVVHSQFTEIGKVGTPAKYEKNWAAFFPGPKPSPSSSGVQWPYFASSVFPRSIVQVDPSLPTTDRTNTPYALGNEIDLTADMAGEMADSNCLAQAFPEWDHRKMHQATPFHRVTMCPRGTCQPTEDNTVLMGIVHYKKDWKRYSRMFVTLSTQAPFRILSVSKPLHFGSAEYDKDVVFAVSMAFFPKGDLKGEAEEDKRSTEDADQWLSHGWLDDTLVIGAGLRDEQYDSIHMDVETATKGHTVCDWFKDI